MLAALSDEATITYQNTGRENERTLEFLVELEEAIGREIVWLEFRPPKTKGARPREFRYERVDFRTAARRGEPFDECMQALAYFREMKGMPPVSPWAKGRICTTHLKHRVLDHYVRDLGIDAHDRFIGLRADEPERVARLRGQETRMKGLYAPLYDAGVTKWGEHGVKEFWAMQSFRLGIEEYEGNCDGCFLKDYSDISRAIGGDEEKIAFWAGMQSRYPRFGGQKHPSYEQLARELPARLSIERALRAGETPLNEHGMDARRFRLTVIQERKRIEHGPSSFSCACESSMGGDEDED